jgi:farnesyl diphosphate synthase
MGEYFQAQDDYLDAFADSATLGKIGTDITDNKCSWLINQALKKVNPEQRKLLEENYGQKDSTKEAKVKELYHELKLKEFYEQWEEERVAELRAKIDKVDESEGLKKDIFEVFLKKIYKRSK